MITVIVLINGQPIFTRSARNIKYIAEDLYEYKVDTGKILFHHRDIGFIPLAKMMLDIIDESNITNKEEP
jgi:hypothetical protein